MLNQLLDLSRHGHDRPAVRYRRKAGTYGKLRERVNSLATRLTAAGVEPGERIALLLTNRPATVVGYLACFQAGFTVVPLDPRYHAAQLNYAIRHSGATVLITHAQRLADVEHCDAFEQLQHVIVAGSECPENYISFETLTRSPANVALFDEHRGVDVAVVFYTSGTTSRPKGVTLTRDAMAEGISKAACVLRLRADDVTLIAAPATRPFALRTQLLPTLTAGGTLELLDQFSPDHYLDALRSGPRKTFVALLPAALQQLLDHPEIEPLLFERLRLCIGGGDRIPHQLFERFHKLAGIELTEQCGMTETGMYAINPPFGRHKPGTIGLPFYGVQLIVVNERGDDVPWGECGEIAVHSRFMMDGYWNDTAATRKVLRDGWIRTGDIGRVDDDGYVTHVGRKKDIIIRGGSNIAPSAVESVLQNVPAVIDVAVVGADDPEWGQTVHAFVTLTAGADVGAAEAALFASARAELPEFMAPESITALPRMPRTGTGKIDRERLRWLTSASDDSTFSVLLE